MKSSIKLNLAFKITLLLKIPSLSYILKASFNSFLRPSSSSSTKNLAASWQNSPNSNNPDPKMKRIKIQHPGQTKYIIVLNEGFVLLMPSNHFVLSHITNIDHLYENIFYFILPSSSISSMIFLRALGLTFNPIIDNIFPTLSAGIAPSSSANPSKHFFRTSTWK